MSACTVASSALVGSSAMSNSGSGASMMAIITRWPMPPDNSCGYSDATRAGSRMRTWASRSMAAARACFRLPPLWARHASATWSPAVMIRVERVFRILQHQPSAAPADFAHRAVGRGQHVDAIERQPVRGHTGVAWQ